ncbi:hypothetical protein NN3_07470 [Nocardia neocaledoniensis NBRC 108232]|uniref:Uncharacterized protein n=1 Tax=Nocardia neocaledoniensis TaxID=236511 RepID=A0A317NF10_9NOCA|nr:TrmB family transcriptional regulator [Nocardia neocaledoniensis]PWV73755.1 hypothetical protein DFR69_107386 [Nocardia neocaledoniensis]GEM29740.1 hypothetical protein NN3_07470 [Nocardia neocaledoniensis NBRC 108232]
MTNTLEFEILAVLRPGGMLTADTIARNLSVPKWRVMRALRALREDGAAFCNRCDQWQVSVEQHRPQRQADR